MRTFLRSCCVLLTFTALLAESVEVDAPADIGSRLELFVDD